MYRLTMKKYCSCVKQFYWRENELKQKLIKHIKIENAQFANRKEFNKIKKIYYILRILCVCGFLFLFLFFAFCLFRFTFNSDNQYFPASYTDIGKLIESRVSEIFEGSHGKEIISLSIYQNDLMMSNVDGIFSFHISWLNTRYHIHLRSVL